VSDLPLPEPLDDFLAKPPNQPASAELRRALLKQTALVVRRRRRARRFLAAGTTAAALLLIALTLWFVSRPEPEGRPAPDDQPRIVEAKVKPGSGTLEAHQPKAPPPVEVPLPAAVALEWKAFDALAGERWTLYRAAGDRYFEDDNLGSALRCYAQAFRMAPADALTDNPDDNWMVSALKSERRKEQ
jgi:hypothetical protein